MLIRKYPTKKSRSSISILRQLKTDSCHLDFSQTTATRCGESESHCSLSTCRTKTGKGDTEKCKGSGFGDNCV